MIYDSKIGKVREREYYLDKIAWRGDERVLDVGCGLGLFLIGAAKRLKTGRAVGIDVWQAEDLSGNTPAGTLNNAMIEGVAEKVEVHTGDARKLPFDDASFDVVLSSMALHNIYDAGERQTAVREIARVLKSGGRVLILDVRHTQPIRRHPARRRPRCAVRPGNRLTPADRDHAWIDSMGLRDRQQELMWFRHRLQMWQWWMSRPMSAAAATSSPKISPHSSKPCSTSRPSRPVHSGGSSAERGIASSASMPSHPFGPKYVPAQWASAGAREWDGMIARDVRSWWVSHGV